MVFKIPICLALVITLASSEYSGLLSRLYKKASDENRPLILVLDNSLKDREEVQAVQSKPLSPEVTVERNDALSLLDLLKQKRLLSKGESKQQLFDHPITDHKHSYLHRLQNRLEKEKRARKERRERKYRAQERNEDLGLSRDDDRNQDRKRERYQVRLDEREDRNQDRKRDRYQYRLDNRDDRNQDRKRERYQDRVDERDQTNRYQNREEKRALRSSVIKNLLRTYNDLNCEAKDECQDECGSKPGKKKNNCEEKCEVKYECEEEKEEDPCDEKDECGDSDEFTSTRGERLVTVTEKCKRC